MSRDRFGSLDDLKRCRATKDERGEESLAPSAFVPLKVADIGHLFEMTMILCLRVSRSRAFDTCDQSAMKVAICHILRIETDSSLGARVEANETIHYRFLSSILNV